MPKELKTTNGTTDVTIMGASLDRILKDGSAELLGHGDELRSHRQVLQGRRAHLQFALNAVDRHIGIVDRALHEIEAS
jgi:hypothetical protein